ncbi:MAG: hypothetical protein R3E87_12205 [Burkholderiaceae bacterium]
MRRAARSCTAADAEGVFVDTHVALGHRRLSIIDRASVQPMTAAPTIRSRRR